jgi:hypothetical protein
MADALDARHRLPRMYARIRAEEVRVPWVRLVAARTRHLSVEAAARVDADMAECADGRIPWSRFCARLEGRIVAADPEAAARKEAEERQQAFAKATRSSADGMKGFYLRAPTAIVVQLDATVAYLAAALKALGDTDTEDERRVKACAVLANPTQAVELLAAFAAHSTCVGTLDDELDDFPSDDVAPPADEAPPDGAREDDPNVAAGSADTTGNPLAPRRFRPAELPGWLARATDPTTSPVLDWPKLLPTVVMFLHLAEETVQKAQDGSPEGVVRWEGEGPITLAHVREQLAPYHSFRVTPVVDLAGQEPVDSYEIPHRHRQAVRLRTPADCFPFAANLGADLDIDHNEAFQHATDTAAAPPGQSRMDNYGPLGRFHHRVKTHGRWQVRQPFDGIYIWRDPHGHHYLVDHTGTRKVTPPATVAPPRKPVVIEIYRPTAA